MKRNGHCSGWIFGLVLITVGGALLLQKWRLPVLVGNWWALFMLIPAIGAFASAWALYRQAAQFTPRVGGLITGGLVPLTIALRANVDQLHADDEDDGSQRCIG
jgi:hypothetical protein